MREDSAALLNLLRCELDATNQQFIHILALQVWGERNAAKRITEVDDVDFVNAMRIVDYLVAGQKPITLRAGKIAPGTDYRSVLVSEMMMETRMREVIEDCAQLDSEAQSLVETARAPREAYADWLGANIDCADKPREPQALPATVTADFSAHLLTLIEQTMIHAFVNWHAGDRASADAAWASSGAVMMQMTRLVQLLASLPGAPAPGHCPAPDIQGNVADTFDADRKFTLLCSQQASTAAERCEHTGIARLCSESAAFLRTLALWQADTPHPAGDTNPSVFNSFEATLSRFIS